MASGINAIRRQIERDARNALNEARDKTSKKLDENLLGFYAGGDPIQYQRTGTLINASNVTPVQGSSDSFGFKAEMDGNRIGYNTGTFTGWQVVRATEEGTSGVVGSPGYWEKTDEEIPDIVDSAFSKRFD